jgi:hypothetical protein
MPKEPKKERSWRDLRSSFSFSGGSKGKVSKTAKGSAAGSSSPRHNKLRKTVDDSREGVKGVFIGLYDFHARKEDEISFNRVLHTHCRAPCCGSVAANAVSVGLLINRAT